MKSFIIRCICLLVTPLLLLLCVTVEPLASRWYTATFGQSSKVLVIHSFTLHYTWKDAINQGIAEGFRKQGRRVFIENEYMDSELFVESEEEVFIRYVLDKRMDDLPDVIIVCDDQATYALLTAEHPLSYQVPIIFCGVDYPNPKILEKHTNVTGFTTVPDFKQCTRLVQSIYPNHKKPSVDVPNNYFGEKAAQTFLKQLPLIVKNEYTIWNLETLSSTDLGWNFNSKTRHTILPVWDSFFCELARNYDYPYFVVNNEGFGQGAIGGYMTTSYDQGYLSALRADMILAGSSPKELGYTPSPKKLLFDWEHLERFHISIKQLPEGATIIKMPFHVRHPFLAGMSVLFILLTVAATTLYFTRRYRKERKEKQQAYLRLQDHKNKLDTAIRSIREGVISVDKNRHIFTINRAALEWLGLGADAEQYKDCDVLSLLNITAPDNEQYFSSMLTFLFAEGQDTLFCEGAQLYSLEGNCTLSVSGEVSGIYQDGELFGAVITFHDITQEIIRREFLTLTMNVGNVFSWQFDPHFKAFVFDPSFFRQFNLTEPEDLRISYRQIRSMIHPKDKEVLEMTITEIRLGQSHQITHQIRANLSGKGYTWWEFRLTRVVDFSGKESGLVYGLLFNIQSYKQIEEELTHAYIKAEQSEKLKSAFLANMSHEIRTPLNGIVGFSNLLTSGDDFDPEEKEVFINTIKTNCDVLLALISDILDLAAIESNNMAFKFVTTDVNELIRQIFITQRVIVPEHLQLICCIPDKTTYLTTDPLRLNQVITNLMNNAVKFTPQGSITIGYYPEESNFLNFYVEDTGKGIAKKDLDAVFIRFFKKDDFTQGAGLGLSICKVIVDRFKGTISVTSKLGVGTRFTVRIPRLLC